MNWGELKTQIQDYMETTFSIDSLTTFVTQAEERIYNAVQFPSLRRNVTGACSQNNRYLQAPDDFLAPYSMAVIDQDGSYHYLLIKDVNFIREAFPIPTGAGNTGRPYCYALFGPDYPNAPEKLAFMLGPTPDLGYGIELHYFYYPTSISYGNIDATTTWLSNNFDTVLLYGALIEAAQFNKAEQDVMANINNKYRETLTLAKRLGDGMERQDQYRKGQVQDQVV
ncbi:MAG: hypothetical protein EBR82_49120 [Caulobacteraceae bacterium]|nr:hypothetical protein [Caulobacteraceae bacterium]